MTYDRLDMLKSLVFIGNENIELFNTYIPKHYSEIYSLYTLLDNADVDYHKMYFKKPIEKDDSFVFLCLIKSNKEYDKLASYLKSINNTISYLKGETFNVVSTRVKQDTEIEFAYV